MKTSTKFWLVIFGLLFIGLQFNNTFFKLEYQVFKFIGLVSLIAFIVAFVFTNIFFLWMYLDSSIKCTDEGIVTWIKYFIIINWVIIIPYEFIKNNITKFNNWLNSL